MSFAKVVSFMGGIVLAIAAYSWWWHGEVDVVAERYDTALIRILPAGTEVSYAVEDSGGFPFRIHHKLKKVVITVPNYGQFQIDSIELIHQPWTKGHMVIHFEGLVNRLDNKAAPVWTLLAGKNLASLVGFEGNRVSYDLDMRDVELQSNEGTLEVPELQYHVRTQGRFGDETTEASLVTKFEGTVPLF